MKYTDKFLEITSLIGEPARAKMLWQLLDRKALTATELSIFAEISAQSTSNHLNKLMDAGLLKVEAQGRHRYYSFADDNAAHAIETLANLISPYNIKMVNKKDPGGKEMMFARSCYDHLAGKLGVYINNFFLAEKLFSLRSGQFILSDKGKNWFEKLGIDLAKVHLKRRAFARPCIDWTERRPHLAGALGAELMDFMVNDDWLKKSRESRIITVTPKGYLKFRKIFGIKV